MLVVALAFLLSACNQQSGTTTDEDSKKPLEMESAQKVEPAKGQEDQLNQNSNSSNALDSHNQGLTLENDTNSQPIAPQSSAPAQEAPVQDTPQPQEPVTFPEPAANN